MHSTRVLDVLVVALSAFGASRAILFDPVFGIHDGRNIAQRQAADDEPQPTGQATDVDLSTSLQTSSSTLSLTTSSLTSSSVITTPSSTTPSTSSTPETTPSSSTPSSTPTPTPTPSTTSTLPDTTTSSTSSSTTPIKTTFSTVTQVVTSTRPDGMQTTYTTEAVSTSTPGLASSGSSSGNTGMSPQTRNTVIGVVVGVGGAIVLAGIAFLALRLYRRRQAADDGGDGLMDYSAGGGAFAPAEKSDVASSGSQNGRNPFQSTLESYHAPTQVNTASNF